MTATLGAELLAALAGALLLPAGGTSLRRLAGSPDRRPSRSPPWWLGGPLAGCPVSMVSGSVLVGTAAGLVVLVALHRLRGRAHRARSDGLRTASLDLVASFAAELRTGSEPRSALATAAEAVTGPVATEAFPPVVAAARGPAADPAAALARVGRTRGCELLADLAAAWRVTESTGAGLAGAAARLAAAARADEAVRRELAAQLAGPRATALLLTGLPVVGLLLGATLGADPAGFLLGTAAGRCCLLAGAALVTAGTVWTEAIVTRAERP